MVNTEVRLEGKNQIPVQLWSRTKSAFNGVQLFDKVRIRGKKLIISSVEMLSPRIHHCFNPRVFDEKSNTSG
jgi:hypothetical protein